LMCGLSVVAVALVTGRLLEAVRVERKPSPDSHYPLLRRTPLPSLLAGPGIQAIITPVTAGPTPYSVRTPPPAAVVEGRISLTERQAVQVAAAVVLGTPAAKPPVLASPGKGLTAATVSVMLPPASMSVVAVAVAVVLEVSPHPPPVMAVRVGLE
jgi:hypothetical protein